MINFTPTNLPCQTLNEQIRSDLRGFFTNNLNQTHKSVFKQYYSACQSFEKVYISQETIAENIGVRRETVNRIVKHFVSLGIMAKITRHRNTCEYSMNEFFFQTSSRRILSFVFNVYLPLALLFSVSEPTITPLNINVLLESNTRSNSRERINYARVCERQDGYLIFDLDKKDNYELKKGGSGHSRQFRQESMLEAQEVLKLRGLIEKFPLTMHGIVKLAVYPVEAIDYAESSLQTVLKARDPFQLFQHLCKQYCEQNRIAVTWSKYYRFKESLGVDDKEPYMNEEQLAPLRIKPTPTTTTKTYGNQKREGKRSAEQEAAIKLANQKQLDSYFVERPQETDYDFVNNCERGVHARQMINAPKAMRWDLLTVDQQKSILAEQHPDCHCRDNLKIEVGLIKPVELITAQPKPMAQFMDKIISRLPVMSELSSESSGNCAKLPVDVPISTKDSSPFDYLDESTGELIDEWE